MSPKGEKTVCKCKHRVYTHSRWREPGSGAFIYAACREPGCSCASYRASDGSRWPDGA